jgi:hypothetical protein
MNMPTLTDTPAATSSTMEPPNLDLLATRFFSIMKYSAVDP